MFGFEASVVEMPREASEGAGGEPAVDEESGCMRALKPIELLATLPCTTFSRPTNAPARMNRTARPPDQLLPRSTDWVRTHCW